MTQLVVVVDTDFPTPDGLDEVVVRAQTSAGEVESRGMVDTAHLPATVSLSPAGANLDVRVTAVGRLHGSDVVASSVATRFVEGESRMVRLALDQRCVGVSCPAGASCAHGCCRREAIAGTALPTFTDVVPPTSSAGEPACPVRAAVYSTFADTAWAGAARSGTYDPPHYATSDPAVLGQHLDAMAYAGIRAGLVWWDGQTSPSDRDVSALLAAARGRAFYWAVYARAERVGDPDVTTIASQLAYVRDHYASDPNYLRVGGRFVVFVLLAPSDHCPAVDNWVTANASVGAYLDVKVPAEWRDCMQPDAWHQYAPATPTDEQPGQSFTLSPGYCPAPGTTCLARDAAAFAVNAAAMVASRAPFHLITSFNDWAAGTAVESGPAWPSAAGRAGGRGAFLDVLHDLDGGT